MLLNVLMSNRNSDEQLVSRFCLFFRNYLERPGAAPQTQAKPRFAGPPEGTGRAAGHRSVSA